MISTEAELYGLILSGGESSRMGQDKSLINYHGKPQTAYLFEMLSTFLPNTFVSVRQDKPVDFTDRMITDHFDSRGPINGILSAMHQFPGKSWLVLACDLPLISVKTISQLIAERDSTRMATAFATKESGFPEPLVAIWESGAAAGLIRHHLEEGRNCPRKFLINSDIKLIHPLSDLELYNANNPDEYQQAKSLIS